MRVRLDRIATFFKGEQVNGDSLSPEFDYPFLNGGINPSGNWKTSNCPANTITVSEGGNSCGHVNFMEEPFWCGAHCYFLADVKGLPKYVYYALKSQQLRLMAQRTGACMPNIKKKDLGAFEFEYNANTDEQKRIAAELDKIVAMKKNAEERLEKLNLLIKARFNEMFGKDKNFSIVKFDTVVWFQEGPGVRNTQYTSSGVKLLNVANLVDSMVDLSTSSRYISEKEAYGRYRHFLVDEGDLIIASSGIKVDYFDKKMGFVMKSQLPLCMNTSTIRFKVLNPDVLNIVYFMYYLKSNDFKAQLIRQITGSAQLNFGPSHLRKMTIPVCDISLQCTFASFVEKVESLKSIAKREAEKLDLLYRSKLQEYFG